MTIWQFNLPLGKNPVTAMAGKVTVSQISSSHVARMPTAMIPFPAPVTHVEKPKKSKFNDLNFKR